MSTSTLGKTSCDIGDGTSTPSSAKSIADTTSDHGPEDLVNPAFGESPLSRKATSIATNGTNHPDFEIDFDGDDDPANPRNWPLWYKGVTIAIVSWSTWV